MLQRTEPTEAPERRNLLLADDDRSFCRVLSRALEGRGFEVLVAHDGFTALYLAEENTPEYAIVDLRLPDISGLKLVEKLKEIDVHTNILVLTSYGSIVTAIEAVKLGATYYLTKPTDAEQIVTAFGRRPGNTDACPAEKPLSVDQLEWEHIHRTLTGFEGNISATARALKMHRRTLQRKLSKHPSRA